jgi:hypothetical protein
MPHSFDVTLPKDQAPVFPDRCVVCGRPRPDRTIKLFTHSIGWWTVVFFSFGSIFSVRVPACRPCGWRLRTWRCGGTLTFIALIAFSMWLLTPVVSAWVSGPLRKLVMMALLLVCGLPYFLWQFLFLPPFDVTAFAKTVDYEFRDREYAREFVILNKGAHCYALLVPD